MKNILLRSLVIGVSSLTPIAAWSGGIDVIETCCFPPRVDIPAMLPGWGISLETSALRSNDNNLTFGVMDLADTPLLTESIAPEYALALRLGVTYTFADAGNMLKLFYEHLFANTITDNFSLPFSTDTTLSFIQNQGSVRQKLDGVTLLSEQHILIGGYWETTFSGGGRFAHLSQELKLSEQRDIFTVPSNIFIGTNYLAAKHTMQFNGGGPLVGLGTLFYVSDSFLLGAEGQAALLIGLNKINFEGFNSVVEPIADLRFRTSNIGDIYSLVPEMYYRIYGNYFYRFSDYSELQVELGWRSNYFFNVRTFNGIDITGTQPIVNSTQSDNIGFSGPYLMVQYNI